MTDTQDLMIPGPAGRLSLRTKCMRAAPGNVVIEDDRHLAMLTRWAEAAQAHGAHAWMQINHAGRQSPKRLVTCATSMLNGGPPWDG